MTAPASAASATLPFTLFDNRMLIAVSLDGKGPFSMIVDTGSSSLVITLDVARRLGIAARAAGRAYGAGSGSSALAAARVPSLAIGALRFRNVNAGVIDLSPIRRKFGFPALDGVIGYDTLRRYRMGIDIDAIADHALGGAAGDSENRFVRRVHSRWERTHSHPGRRRRRTRNVSRRYRRSLVVNALSSLRANERLLPRRADSQRRHGIWRRRSDLQRSSANHRLALRLDHPRRADACVAR